MSVAFLIQTLCSNGIVNQITYLVITLIDIHNKKRIRDVDQSNSRVELDRLVLSNVISNEKFPRICTT